MSDATAKLKLPFLAAAQAQKHVTHNEALLALDAIVQASVEDRDLSAPPPAPGDGQAWIAAASATGDWAGHDGELAVWTDGAWRFYAPRAGWIVLVRDENRLVVFNGSIWRDFGGMMGALANLDKLGVNTSADAANRLAAKSDAVLFSHDDVTPGSGDVRVTLNKKQTDKTASFLFQNNWSGRAEIGLTGDDGFHVKVSANGADWKTALSISGSGMVHMHEPLEDDLRISGATPRLILQDRTGAAQSDIILQPNPAFTSNILWGHLGLFIRDFDENASPPQLSGDAVGIGWTLYSYTPYFYDRNGEKADILTTLRTRVKSYAVASAPSAPGRGEGSIIFVSDESGGPVLAFSDGTDWRRVTDRAVIS